MFLMGRAANKRKNGRDTQTCGSHDSYSATVQMSSGSIFGHEALNAPKDIEYLIFCGHDFS